MTMAQTERDGGEVDRVPPVPVDVSGDVIISHDWARRRLDLYERMERTLREEITHALRTAAEIRTDVERDADSYMRRVRTERTRIAGEISDLNAERRELADDLERRRAQLESDSATRRGQHESTTEHLRAQVHDEVELLRTRVERDVADMRVSSQAEAERMLHEAEARRVSVMAEVRSLEEQVTQIQAVVDSFLDNQLRSLRGNMGTVLDPRSSATQMSSRSEPATTGRSLLEEIAALRSQVPRELPPRPTAPPATRPARRRAETRSTASTLPSDIRTSPAAPRPPVAAAALARVGEEVEQEVAALSMPVLPPPTTPPARDDDDDVDDDDAAFTKAPPVTDDIDLAVEEALAAPTAMSAPPQLSVAAALAAAPPSAPVAAAAPPRPLPPSPVTSEVPPAVPTVPAAVAEPAVPEVRAEAIAPVAAPVTSAPTAPAPEPVTLAPEPAIAAASPPQTETVAATPAAEVAPTSDDAAAPAPSPGAVAPEDAPSAAPEIGRTSVVISGVPGFSRALALQRAVQQVAGVTEAKAIGYERGVLGLDVQHDAAVDLAARFTALPGIRLRLVESAPGQLQLSAEA